MKRTILIAMFLVILLTLTFPGVALAKGFQDDKIVAGGTFTLKSGETLDGNLIIFGGVVTLENNSQVNGDAVLLGGTLTIDGTVEGDVVGIGGVVTLEENAVIKGSLTTVAAIANRADSAQVEGQIITGLRLPAQLPSPGGVQIPNIPNVPSVQVRVSPILSGLWFLFRAFLWAAVAAIVVLFLPNPTNRVTKAIVEQPLLAGGIGLLTAIVAPLFLIVIAITIILIPVSLLGVLLLVIAWFYGRVALGLELGRRIGHMFNRDWPLALAAGVGSFVLALVVDGVGELIWCVGWMFPVLVGILGFGGVLLTRFGTQSFPQYRLEPEVPSGIRPATPSSPPDSIDGVGLSSPSPESPLPSDTPAGPPKS